MTASPPLHIITRVPIPAALDPSAVLQALQAYEPLIKGNPYLHRFEQRPVDINEIASDQFFREDGSKLQAFVVVDRVPIVPGLGSWATKEVSIPCVFQCFEHGVRVRAHAQAGVVVRSSYEVRRRGEVQGGPELLLGPGDEGDYELVEVADVSCNALVKPFVKSRFVAGHLELLQKIVDSVGEAAGTQVGAAENWQ
ncbi:hypothetical protein QBC42DRAFT_308116 [Cladorrhinum samala]|uniref:DUF7053 domain-containing protein n=1 Tax=Cladorrhinum samala TaxID=585594 RepID=A0AAV9HE12_9PEZI|nr:hypothetical protein QBC42DRAFT_308116 [Cladorrhinum samala]